MTATPPRHFLNLDDFDATTLRGMAEATANVVCEKLGLEVPCTTRESVLLPHTAYYA